MLLPSLEGPGVCIPFLFHTPDPFQKGRADAVGLLLWLGKAAGRAYMVCLSL